MSASSTSFDVASIAPWLLNEIFVEAPKKAAGILWNQVLIPILSEHWLEIGAVLFLVFFVLILQAMAGCWGSLGSFLYHFLYFSTLFIIGLIWGPEVFVSNWINFFTALVLYPICYWIVGWMFDVTGLKSKWLR